MKKNRAPAGVATAEELELIKRAAIVAMFADDEPMDFSNSASQRPKTLVSTRNDETPFLAAQRRR